MPRRQYVKRARKDQGTCDKCGKPIVKGDSYVWVALRPSTYSSMKKKRHATCPDWKMSELTFGSLQPVYAAQEAAESALFEAKTVDDVRTAAQDFIAAIEEYVAECQDKRDNLVDGFGHETQASELQQERIDGGEAWVQGVQNLVDELEDEPFCPECNGSGRVQADDEHQNSDDGMMPCTICDETGNAAEGSEAMTAYLDTCATDLQSEISESPF